MLCNPRSVRFPLAMPLSPRLGEDPFQASRDVDFRLHTHDAIHLAAGAEDQQCWNATHVEARCGHRVLVHIQLRDTPCRGISGSCSSYGTSVSSMSVGKPR